MIGASARRGELLIALGTTVLLMAGCSTPEASSGHSDVSSHRPLTTASAPSGGGASAALAALVIKGRAPLTGYVRSQFGPSWTDSSDAPWSRNGLDTREDILSRDLSSVACKSPSPVAAAPHCIVNAGVLLDPYTGATIHFTRGVTASLAVQIDHVVALGDAWQTGAQALSFIDRTSLANDPLNLIAVDGPINESKGDSDTASWLPPNKAFRCTYVARQVAVKAKYHLWVTVAERAAMSRVLSACPGQPLPTSADAERRTEVLTPG